VGTVALVAILAASCTPDPIDVAVEVEVERAVTCADLIPTGVALAVQLLAAIETVPIDVLTGDAPAQGSFADLLASGRLFDDRAESLGCDPGALNAEIMAEIDDDVNPRSLAGALLLQIMQSGSTPPGEGTTSETPPPTTTGD
jgi:hypothetical protein